MKLLQEEWQEFTIVGQGQRARFDHWEFKCEECGMVYRRDSRWSQLKHKFACYKVRKHTRRLRRAMDVVNEASAIRRNK